MAWEWLSTAGNWLDTGGKILNAAQPFLNTGASVYDRNQTRSAIGNAFGDYQNYANQSMNTLGQIYQQGTQSTQPYRAAGENGLAGYMNLLNNPNQITNNPGYKFRFDQGREALQRSAASKRLLNSGNFATAAQEYGQGFATQEYDNALSRYLPMVQAGQNAVGQQVQAGQNYGNATAAINLGIGEAAAGSQIGQAGANSRMVTDFLGLTGGQNNPFGQAADAASGARTLGNSLRQIGNLLNGSSAAPAVSGIGTAGATTAGSALGALGASQGAAQLAGVVPAGSQYAGMLTTMDALGGGAAGVSGAGTTVAGTTGAGTAGASGAGTAMAGNTLAAAGVFALPLLMAGISKFGQGGSAESAKSPKLAAQLQRDAQADPTGRTAQATIDRLITNQLWPEEGNQWVISDLMKSGAVTLNTPSLYSSNSVVDVFADPDYLLARIGSSRNTPAEAKIIAMGAGFSQQQADDYVLTLTKYRNIDTSDMTTMDKSNQLRLKAKIDGYNTQIRNAQRANAQNTYATLRGQGYTGDLSKLESYLGMR